MNPDSAHRILTTPVALPQHLAGPITFTRPSGALVTLEGEVNVDQDIEGTAASNAQVLHPGHEHCDVAGDQWRAPDSLVMLVEHSQHWNDPEQRYDHSYRYRFYAPEITVGAGAEHGAFTRESFLGLEIAAPYKSYEADGSRHLRENWLPIEIFGREGVMYKARTEDGRDCLSIIHTGPVLSGDQRAALLWLVRYLAGASESVTITESFDEAQSRTMSRVQPHGTGTRQSLPPLLYNRIPGYADERLRHVFGSMLARLTSLMATPKIRRRLFGVLLAYLDAADTHYANTRGRCAVIALDALMSLATTQKKLIEDKAVSTQLREKLEAVVDLVAPEAARQAVKDNLNVNSESVNARRRRFFEYLGIEYTTPLQKLIRELRNPAVHEGTFGADDVTPEGLKQNIRTAEQAIDLFNRAMLSFLGYDGASRMHEVIDEHMPPRERAIRDRFPDIELDRLTSRAAGLTQFMRPEITHEHTQAQQAGG